MGKLLTQIMSSVAEFESNLIGERVSIAKAASVAKGRRNGGPRPYGYRQSKGALNVIQYEHAILHRMRQELLAARSMSEVARGLNRDGVTTVRGAAWSQSRISQIFANRLYIGYVRNREVEVRGTHEPIFTLEEWAQVQDVLVSRRRAPGGGRGRRPMLHLFARGMLRCGYCGQAIAPRRTRNAQGRVYESYRCVGQLQGTSPDCRMPSIPRRAVQHLLAAGIDLDATRAHIAEQIEATLTVIRAALTQAELQVMEFSDSLVRVRRDYQAGNLSAAEWRENRAELTSELDAVAAKAKRLRDHAEDVAAEGIRVDTEQELLEALASLRAAIAGELHDAESVESARLALGRLFSGWTLHNYAALRDGGVNLPGYFEPELMVPGHGALYIEPHVRAEVILDTDDAGCYPRLRRVPLTPRVKDRASALSTFASTALFGPARCSEDLQRRLRPREPQLGREVSPCGRILQGRQPRVPALRVFTALRAGTCGAGKPEGQAPPSIAWDSYSSADALPLRDEATTAPPVH
jgi:hypothetical protein